MNDKDKNEYSYYPLFFRSYGKSYIANMISEKEEKINNLQSKIDKVNELLEGRKERVEDLSWVEMKVEDYIEEINEIEFILKEDK